MIKNKPLNSNLTEREEGFSISLHQASTKRIADTKLHTGRFIIVANPAVSVYYARWDKLSKTGL